MYSDVSAYISWCEHIHIWKQNHTCSFIHVNLIHTYIYIYVYTSFVCINISIFCILHIYIIFMIMIMYVCTLQSLVSLHNCHGTARALKNLTMVLPNFFGYAWESRSPTSPVLRWDWFVSPISTSNNIAFQDSISSPNIKYIQSKHIAKDHPNLIRVVLANGPFDHTLWR